MNIVCALRAGVIVGALTLVQAGCSGGGGSAPVPPAPEAVAPPPPPAQSKTRLTSFEENSVLRGLVFGHGFTSGMNDMVRQFAGGAASGDVDGNGFVDLFVVRGDAHPNLLFLNDGSSFRESAAIAGLDYTGGVMLNLRHSGPVFGDVDGDGDLDLFIGGLEGDSSKLFLNDGTGVFSDATIGSGFDQMTSAYTISAAMGDYDLDGDLDIAMAHWGTPRDSANPGETETLWRNDTDAMGVRFTAVSQSAGISSELALNLENGALGANIDYTFAPSFADINDDGYPDLLSVSDFRGSRVFLNNTDGTFSNITDPAVIDDENGMGSAVGDFDNDGDLDWFVSSINGNRLYENDGSGVFSKGQPSLDVGPGGWGWGSCFADFNADGRLDIYQTNGWFEGSDPANSPYVEDTSRLWMSNEDGTFSDNAEDSNMIDTEQGRGIICDDFNGDGDVDVLLLTTDVNKAAWLWENQLTDADTLKVRLSGPPSNQFGLGAKVLVTTPNSVQTRWVGANSNFVSHNSTDQYFGLEDGSTNITVEVTWSDGTTTSVDNVQVSSEVIIEYSN